MLGLSLTKILFTIGIVVAVWRGWKMVEYFRDKIGDEPQRSQSAANCDAGQTARAQQREQARQARRGKNWFKWPSSPPQSPPPPAVELVPCPHCGTYIANDRMFDHAKECPNRPS